MNHVLVIGATGNVGPVISQLPVASTCIHALTRNPQTACLPEYVEVVRGDLTVPETLEAALDDVDAVFLVWAAAMGTAASVLGRIARHARRVVPLSSPNTSAHLCSSNRIRSGRSMWRWNGWSRNQESGGQSCAPECFPQMREAGGRLRSVQRISCAGLTALSLPRQFTSATLRLGVRSLCDDSHAGAEYVLTGPESLSQSEQVYAIGNAIGRNLRFDEISPGQARRELVTVMPAFVIGMLLDAWAAALGQPALITSTVERITGEPGRTFLQWSKDHASDFRA